MKDTALRDGERYVSERTRFLHPTSAYSSAEKYTTSSGDLCSVGFDVTPLHGASSVKQVYDALRLYFFNMEIMWTETSSDLMIREGDDDGDSVDQSVSVLRFLRSTDSGFLVESNSVMSSGYDEASDTAVVAGDYVNADALYPYIPSERLRQDVTSAITLKAHPTTTTSDDGAAGDAHVVVLARSYHIRVHRSELDVPADTLEEMTLASKFCFQNMLDAISGTVSMSRP